MKMSLKLSKKDAVQSWEQADELLHQLGAYELQMEQLDLALEEKLREIRSQAVQERAPIAASHKVLCKMLEAWLEGSRDDISVGPGRTLELQWGKVGLRISPPKLVGVPSSRKPDELEAFIQRMRDLRLGGACRVTVDVNKDVLAAASEDKLAALGCRLDQSETIWWEARREEVFNG